MQSTKAKNKKAKNMKRLSRYTGACSSTVQQTKNKSKNKTTTVRKL